VTDANNRLFKVHRRSIHPARRVSEEWSSLILNDDTTISTEDETCTEWLDDFYSSINFINRGHKVIADAFGLGTAGWAVWIDTERKQMQVRRYDARMILPLSWDDDGVKECAFATKTTIGGVGYDQLSMHVLEDETYHIKTFCFTEDTGKEVDLEEFGILDDLDTKSPSPTFAVVTPAIVNSFVDFSPYGQSVFAEHADVMKSVDLAYDAIFNEVDLAKLRIFMSDIMFEVDRSGSDRTVIPFGKDDATVYRKVSSTDDVIREFAPAMRTEQQLRAYRLAVQEMGDVCGFGSQYFDIDKTGGLKTATEVSSDNSALMRNIKRHEGLISGQIAQISHAVLHIARVFLDVALPDEGEINVSFNDSIITDTQAQKAQDLAEVGVTMNAWEYRHKWYGEDEETAKANAPKSGYEAPEASDIFS